MTQLKPSSIIATFKQRKKLMATLFIVMLTATIAGIYATHAINSLLRGAESSPFRIPPLSSGATQSAFARANNLDYSPPNLPELPDSPPLPYVAGTLNIDSNRRPQNEPAIAVKPGDPTKWVGSANDYETGAPIGTGVYTHDTGPATSLGRANVLDTFPPFPLLVGLGAPASSPAGFGGGTPGVVFEVPLGTGDPALAYGRTRAAAGFPAGLPVVYLASIGFTASYCENGVFVYRSLNDGVTWTRPVVPFFAPPTGLRTVVYYDSALNCNVFHDKEWIAVDNTGGVHDGRIYVTWTQFTFASGNYRKSPIMMAFSDNNGETFSAPIEISGSSATLCGPQVAGLAGECDQDQISIPVVGSDGSVYVHFLNFNVGPPFRSRIFVVKVTPTGPSNFSLSEPFMVAEVFDGNDDFPIQAAGTGNRQTLCNSNFRIGSFGNIAVVPDGNSNAGDDVLYVVWSDNRQHAGQFPFPTRVIQTAPSPTPSFECPAGKFTDTDVYLMKSADGGVTWSNPVTGSTTNPLRVNQDPLGNNKDQFYAWVAVHPTPSAAPLRVDVVFYDRRNSITPTFRDNHVAETFVARSPDGGQTWTEFPVSTFASNFDNAFMGVGTFIGDYLNIAIATNGAAYALWAGVSPGRRDSDIFAFVEY